MIELPTASIRKIVKAAIPEGTQVGKEATSAFAKAAGLFILYVTQAANVIADTDKRQTIKGEDIIEALEELDFTELAGPLKAALEDFRKAAAEKRRVAKKGFKENSALSPASKPGTVAADKGKGKLESGAGEGDAKGKGALENEGELSQPLRKKQKTADATERMVE